MNFITLDRKGIGADLKHAREHLRLSLSEVADLSGVAASHIWHLEKGNKNVSLDRFVLVCASLGLAAADILSDNLLINRQQIFESAIKELGAADEAKGDKPATFDFARKLLAADYAAGCSIILAKSIATGDLSAARWTFPTKELQNAFDVVFQRLTFDGLRVRWDFLRQLGTAPIGVLTKLGLWTRPLVDGFTLNAVSGADKKLKPWVPSYTKCLPRLYTASFNPMAALDPQKLGGFLSDIAEHTSGAQARTAMRYLKKRKKAKNTR